MQLVGIIGTANGPGGQEGAFRRLIDGLQQATSWKVTVVTHRLEDARSGYPVDVVLRPTENVGRVAGLARLSSFIAEQGRDTVLFPFGFNSNVLAVMANALAGRRFPVVMNDRCSIEHLLASPDPRMMSILVARARRQAAAVAYRQAAAIVCNSSANARQIRDLIGRNAPQVFCIYNPVDSVGIQRRFAYRDRRVWVNGRPLITAHGRLDIRQKGWDTLLRAFAVVQGKCRDARLRIVGGGRDERRLRDLAMALGVAESVEMIGHFDDPLPLVEEGDIYVLPSRFEGFPNSLLEAMAAGLPVIAADCKTGPREVIGDDEYGMLFPVDDVHALANGIEFLLESGHVRSTLAERGRERARDFALEEAIEGFREVIGSCVYGAGTVRCVG